MPLDHKEHMYGVIQCLGLTLSENDQGHEVWAKPDEGIPPVFFHAEEIQHNLEDYRPGAWPQNLVVDGESQWCQHPWWVDVTDSKLKPQFVARGKKFLSPERVKPVKLYTDNPAEELRAWLDLDEDPPADPRDEVTTLDKGLRSCFKPRKSVIDTVWDDPAGRIWHIYRTK